jgi:hypothetical protein
MQPGWRAGRTRRGERERHEVTALLWQRFTARRALTDVPVDGWGSGPVRRHVPMIVREPESSWWENHPEHDAERHTEDPAGDHTRGTLTVAAVREGDAGRHPESLVSRLAEIAAEDDLLVIFGAAGRSATQRMVARLREQVPWQDVVAMPVRHRHAELLRDAATVERLLDVGVLPVVISPPIPINEVTAEIASYLRADRVLRVLGAGPAADLCRVWQRDQAALPSGK